MPFTELPKVLIFIHYERERRHVRLPEGGITAFMETEKLEIDPTVSKPTELSLNPGKD